MLGARASICRLPKRQSPGGRARSRVVLIRVGSRRDEPYFSAGDAPVFGNDGEPLSVWPPHRE